MKIEIKSIFGSVLFEYDCKSNTIRKTLEKAIESSANLSSADLNSADLSSANLSGADLSSADLRSANLSGADLIVQTLGMIFLTSKLYDVCSANELHFKEEKYIGRRR
jgi:uncharacterized protein YjbI with pentapeptide repeats